jgi:peptidylprolyl isomerase
MAEAERGNTVRIHYTGTLQDKSQFDSSHGRAPLEFTVGKGEVLKGVDEAVLGMKPGEQKTVTIPAEEAYGPHRAEFVHEVERSRISDEVDLKVGTVLQATNGAGDKISLTVVSFNDDTVKVDANHPLAGEDLTFDLQLVEIV